MRARTRTAAVAARVTAERGAGAVGTGISCGVEVHEGGGHAPAAASLLAWAQRPADPGGQRTTVGQEQP
ncbi:hypothetical protein AVL61_07190 [Kocuria rosea subsp. polaris]|uniref:Uncharacterized protein n=1 Tax=Kocuria rosea subsp. polaris TaxID=136273 RepID=A0A0W8I306_KOCRO|nr:hypothetical protein AVL61_07190 [Kocuria polaris]